jgi:hypothetical protein
MDNSFQEINKPLPLKKNSTMSDFELYNFESECNNYVEQQDSKKTSSFFNKTDCVTGHEKDKVVVSFRDDDIMANFGKTLLTDIERVYLDYLFDELTEDDEEKLSFAVLCYKPFALILLLQKKHITIKMLSYAFNIRVLAAGKLFFNIYRYSYIDDYGRLKADNVAAIKSELNCYKDMFLTKDEKRIFDSISKCDIDNFSEAADDYYDSHDEIALPKNHTVKIQIRDDSELDSLYFDNLTEKEKQYLNDLYLGKEDDEDYGIFEVFPCFALELAKEKGRINTKMISYAFDIDVFTAYRIMERMITIDNSLNENGTVNYDLIWAHHPYKHDLEQGIKVDCHQKEIIESLPKSDFVKFNNDMNEYYQQLNEVEEVESEDEYICTDIDEISIYDHLSDISTVEKGTAFEEYCASLLKLKGFKNITLTEASGDHGIDILAEKDEISYAIQCKYYSGTVGNSAVQEAYSGKKYYDCEIAVVMTNSIFTVQAREEAEINKVKLWDGEVIKNMFS